MKYLVIIVVVIGGLFVLMKMNFATPHTTDTSTPAVAPAEVTIPTGLPDNVLMYPGAVLVNSSDTPGESERNVTLSLKTSDSIPDVVSWYRDALGQNGWAVTDDKNVGGYILLKGENGSVTVFMQSANQEDGSVLITERVRMRN